MTTMNFFNSLAVASGKMRNMKKELSQNEIGIRITWWGRHE